MYSRFKHYTVNLLTCSLYQTNIRRSWAIKVVKVVQNIRYTLISQILTHELIGLSDCKWK